MSVWMITGCSTGLGRHLAEVVLAAGHQVAVTARDPRQIAELVERHPESALGLRLDVTDPEQLDAAVAATTERWGRIDVLVNNAGYGYRAAVEEGEDPVVHDLFAANFFGPVALIKAVLPGMRDRRHGAVINISSIAATISPAGSGYYAAAKAAIEALSASLRKEVEPLGIKIMAVEPGGFRTDFGGRSLHQTATVIDDYANTAGRRRTRETPAEQAARRGDPTKAAAAMLAAIEDPNPPSVLVLGEGALTSFRGTLDHRRGEADRWERTSVDTAFDD